MPTELHTLIRERLDRSRSRSDQEQLNTAKEIVQEIALLGLSRSGFFQHAAFHGGSALRIAYDLDRFSEDLNFALIKPDAGFRPGRSGAGPRPCFAGPGLPAYHTRHDSSYRHRPRKRCVDARPASCALTG